MSPNTTPGNLRTFDYSVTYRPKRDGRVVREQIVGKLSASTDVQAMENLVNVMDFKPGGDILLMWVCPVYGRLEDRVYAYGGVEGDFDQPFEIVPAGGRRGKDATPALPVTQDARPVLSTPAEPFVPADLGSWDGMKEAYDFPLAAVLLGADSPCMYKASSK